MIAVRKQHPALGRGDFAWLSMRSPAIAAYWRTFDRERILVLQNLSDQPQTLELPHQPQHWLDLLTGARVTLASLAPYQFVWLLAT